MPSRVAASRQGHRRSEEEDLGHVRPPDSAGGERERGGHVATIFRFFLIGVIIFSHEAENPRRCLIGRRHPLTAAAALCC